MFKRSLISLLALSCVNVKRFGTLVGDKSQKLGDKSQQPSVDVAALQLLLKVSLERVRSVPTCRDARRNGTGSNFGPLLSFVCNYAGL